MFYSILGGVGEKRKEKEKEGTYSLDNVCQRLALLFRSSATKLQCIYLNQNTRNNMIFCCDMRLAQIKNQVALSG
jgi:hypothetical protein